MITSEKVGEYKSISSETNQGVITIYILRQVLKSSEKWNNETNKTGYIFNNQFT